MKRAQSFPPDAGSQPPAPGEVPRSGASHSWLAVGVALFALIAALFSSSQLDELKRYTREMLPAVSKPAVPPVAAPRTPSTVAPAKPAARPTTPHDDLARPLAFYFARWGVVETLSPIGWTSRVEIRATPSGGATAHLWITCPKGLCDAGEFAVSPVAHLQKKDQTAYLAIERRESDRVWTLLLRPAAGRPDLLERWEWYGPPASAVRTQSLLGHVSRLRPDGSFH